MLVSYTSEKETGATNRSPSQRKKLRPINILKFFNSIEVPYDTLGTIVVLGCPARNNLATAPALGNQLCTYSSLVSAVG
jgi:hypothetical protein